MSADTIVSRYAPGDAPLTLDPAAKFWSEAAPVQAWRGRWGEPAAARPTEIRSRWSDGHLYLLFVCPYERMHLKPDPQTAADTDHLWDWDVAEAFIAADPAKPERYTEYEVSPQGEWVDLEIGAPNAPKINIHWNSGFESATRVDRARKVWYAGMKIPMKSLNIRPAAGVRARVNFYRIEGGPPERTYVTWQATQSETFHVPKAFGWLTLEGAQGR